MDGITQGEGFIRTVDDQNWQIAGIGAFDGDGKTTSCGGTRLPERTISIRWMGFRSGQRERYHGPLPTRPGKSPVSATSMAMARPTSVENRLERPELIYLMNGTAILAEGYLAPWRIPLAGERRVLTSPRLA